MQHSQKMLQCSAGRNLQPVFDAGMGGFGSYISLVARLLSVCYPQDVYICGCQRQLNHTNWQ
jgi:hypothetical protein